MIGSGYGIGNNNNACGLVSNIIINSGNIVANKISGHGAAIGAADNSDANNIIINGGNIYTTGRDYQCPLGSTNSNSGKVVINGGNITAIGKGDYCYGAIGGGCNEVIIAGGTIRTTYNKYSGICCAIEGKISITAGNILTRGKNNINIAKKSGSSIVSYIPTDGTNSIYETQIKLNSVGENERITSIVTSDNISYGIKDMYTLEDGMLYLYLPEGSRTITIECNGKTYSGTVETSQTGDITTLNSTN